MAAYTVELRPRARKKFLALDKPARERVGAAIDALADDPYPAGQTLKVRTTDTWRIRVGDYRVTYAVDDDARIVTITWVGHRKDAYRDRS